MVRILYAALLFYSIFFKSFVQCVSVFDSSSRVFTLSYPSHLPLLSTKGEGSMEEYEEANTKSNPEFPFYIFLCRV